MADTRRFPRLSLPFAVAGAAAGWLSAGLLANPMVSMLYRALQPVAALAAAVLGAVTGAVVRRLCVGRSYGYSLDAPDPSTRAPTDRTASHVGAVLACGALTGAFVGLLCRVDKCGIGALGGLLCAFAFVPVALAVIAAARRAQRARLGTIVAASDRRAVWAILATSLALTTLEALPDWLADDRVPRPFVALAMLAAAAASIAFVLARDLGARAHVEIAGAGLEPAEHLTGAPVEIDLGLGEGAWAHVARGASAYRHVDRAVDLVRGDPALARAAIARARRRDLVALALVAATALVHLVAAMPR